MSSPCRRNRPAMFTADSVAFLKDFAANNDRSWFTTEKRRYEAALKAPAKAFSAALELARRRSGPGQDLPHRSRSQVFQGQDALQHAPPHLRLRRRGTGGLDGGVGDRALGGRLWLPRFRRGSTKPLARCRGKQRRRSTDRTPGRLRGCGHQAGLACAEACPHALWRRSSASGLASPQRPRLMGRPLAAANSLRRGRSGENCRLAPPIRTTARVDAERLLRALT